MKKILALLVIVILVLPSSYIITQNAGLHANTSDWIYTLITTETSQKTSDALHAIQLADVYQTSDLSTPFGEDDGHTHVFHFDRIKGKRRKMLLYFTARSILIITHLCWLIKEIIHLSHYSNN